VAVQVREIMTRQVAAVRPDTSAKYAAEVMAARGFAALPVVDDKRAVIGIVAEADVLRGRLPQDPRLHLRREETGGPVPPLLVGGIMTTRVRTVSVTADVADVARLFIDEQLRSVPVVDGERLVGIVSRRDVLRALIRRDDDIRRDVHRLVEAYTGQFDRWSVEVAEGVVTLSRAPTSMAGRPGDSAGQDGDVPEVADEDIAVEVKAVQTLARTVPGVVAVRLHPTTGSGAATEDQETVDAVT
jgi:CBS domain-containing protein